jgi:hypothetical protein
MSNTSTAANQDNLPKDSNTIGENVTAEFTLVKGLDCPPAAEETPVTHTCISAEYGHCQVFDDNQFRRLKELQEKFQTIEDKSWYETIDKDERRQTINAVLAFAEDCQTSFDTVSSALSHGQYIETCTGPWPSHQYHGQGFRNT